MQGLQPMGMMGGSPVYVLQQNTKRDTGRKAQLANIAAARAVADIVRTSVGPQAMLKMILDPMGGIVISNDGNSILREIEVTHPAAKSIIDLSRTQDEEVGDGTTSVIVLAGEMMTVAEPLLERNIHPTVIVQTYFKALDDAVKIAESQASFTVDPENREQMLQVIHSCLGTKFVSKFSTLMTSLALDAVKCVTVVGADGRRDIDIKRYARLEKIPGGDITESCVLRGVMINKDIIHPKMPRRIVRPRVVLMDCPIEFTKNESATNVEITNEDDWETLVKMEEETVQRMVKDILRVKPTVVVTEKGVSDYAAHLLMKAGVSVMRRMRKTDNVRIARVSGATIANRTEELTEEDVGTECGLFEVRKIGDEYFAFFEDCANPKACTVLLRGPSKDFLNEVERNLHDAMLVARNVLLDPRMCVGGGAFEMQLSQSLSRQAKKVEGIAQYAYQAVAGAMEVIPRTLAQNCGANVVRTITELRAKHASSLNSADEQNAPLCVWGIDGENGKITDMKAAGIWEPLAVKVQTVKTAIESAALLLRIDDIVSGIKNKAQKDQEAKGQPVPDEDAQPEDRQE
nr:T-complex protein 1 subunit gamma [Andalucia godoyi]|eukprot:ANDGO_00772.mRNA.1 T-complex protein 1 subunit gamma